MLDSRVRLRSSARPFAAFIWLSAAAAGCNSMEPTPIQPPPPPPPPNTPPVITSLTASRVTLEKNETVQLTAVVTDAESGPERLQIIWSSTDGTFTGQGLSQTWAPAPSLVTPIEMPLTLTIVESYQGLNAQGVATTLEHRVNRSVTVRIHDSVKELGDMGVSFLNKFADSELSPDACLVDFSDSCRGKASEREDIESNRENFLVLDHTLGAPRVTNLSRYTRGNITISCAFESRRLKCPANDEDCDVGDIEEASGTCRLEAIYERGRWWLCTSNFSSSSDLSPGMRLFFGASADNLP